jgi:hypothetical protein
MEKLRQVLGQADTVLFVGSGISMWSGLPSWFGFIEELAKFVEASGENADLVRSEAQRGDLLQAASYGFYKLTKPQVGDFVRAACKYGTAKPHEIHKKLVSLGPRCFVTTNYDNLIEESLRIWQPDRFFRPPVTNRQLTEIAGIIYARATDFVFKPHGDAADTDSIILTREQYRQLLPEGERHAALESLKMLLATRPVVYIGFGLRDPDFIYIRDLLSNTYKGGTRDHYAIMADTHPAEVDYWRKTYGIHLIGYTTTDRMDNSRDHSPLLKLLDDLLVVAPVATYPVAAPIVGTSSPADTILALARHAAGLTRAAKKDPEFPLRVHSEEYERRKGRPRYRHDQFNSSTVEHFLDEGPSRALLIGLPGSGKSYSLQRAAARSAERLHDVCLSERLDEKEVVVPMLADLKLYRGDLFDLINGTLPRSLSLDSLGQCFKVKIFLDSFNEMPREYWESGSYEVDFARFLEINKQASIIIGSRTNDGLDKLEFPSYCIDQIDEGFVSTELERLKINVSGRFRGEVESLLQQPFYFQLVSSGTINLPEEAHPRDFFATFFRGLTSSFRERFGRPFNLEHALSLCAYKAINQGEEAQPLGDVLEVLQTQLQGTGFGEVQATEVANWLVSKSVVIPYRGARLAFFHQSATEYLAACELARRYQETPKILKEKLRLTRWDQALFLTLSLLPASSGEALFKTVVETDFALALNATKYVEVGRDELVAKLLAEIPGRVKSSDRFENEIEWAVQHALPISDAHEPQLRAVMKCGSIIGAAAVVRLVELKGLSVKEELLQVLIEARDDYNYCCHGIGKALQDFASPEDIQKIVTLADCIQDEVPHEAGDEVDHGFICGAATFLEKLDIEIIRKTFLPVKKSAPLSEIRARIICNVLNHHHSTAALDLSAELLARGVDEAATCIYFISKFARPEDRLSWSSFSRSQVDRLLSISDNEDRGIWALRALRQVCSASPDMAEVVRVHALRRSGIARASLLWCMNYEQAAAIFEALAQLEEMSSKDRRRQPIHLIDQLELNWEGQETLYVRLLRLRDTRLAQALLGSMCPIELTIGELEIGPLGWWLEWLKDAGNTDGGHWFQALMASLFATKLSARARQPFVAEFNKPNSPFRDLLANAVLPHFPDLSTDMFAESTILFLLADLNRNLAGSYLGIRGHLLGTTATELFVTERLLPLLPDAKPPLLKKLREVLREAGSRHGRRYVVS